MKAFLADCGCAVLAGSHVGFAGVSAAFGLSLLAMVYTIGPISGCHLNPAVTLGLALSGKFAPGRLPGCMAAQIAGAIVAAGVLYLIASGNSHFDAVASGFASNGYGTRSPDGYSLGSAFLAELVLTAILVLTILGATDFSSPVGFAGVAIGLCLTLIHLVSIPITDTSVNPARSIGPALFAGPAALGQLWLFIVAPLASGATRPASTRSCGRSSSKLSYRPARRPSPCRPSRNSVWCSQLKRSYPGRTRRASGGTDAGSLNSSDEGAPVNHRPNGRR